MLEPRLQEDELGEDDTIRDLPHFSSADRDGLRVDHVCGVFIVFLVWFEDSIHMATSWNTATACKIWNLSGENLLDGLTLNVFIK